MTKGAAKKLRERRHRVLSSAHVSQLWLFFEIRMFNMSRTHEEAHRDEIARRMGELLLKSYALLDEYCQDCQVSINSGSECE